MDMPWRFAHRQYDPKTSNGDVYLFDFDSPADMGFVSTIWASMRMDNWAKQTTNELTARQNRIGKVSWLGIMKPKR